MALQSSNKYKLSRNDEALWHQGLLSLNGIEEAWRKRRDRRLAEYIVKLVQLDPESDAYVQAKKAGDPNYQQLLDELSPWRLSSAVQSRGESLGVSFEFGEMNRQQVRAVIASIHKEQWDHIEAHEDALPERLRVYKILEELWKSEDVFAREILLEVIREVPLKWGPWRAIKRIYKESIQKRDWVIFGAIAARIDYEATLASSGHPRPISPFSVSWNAGSRDVSQRTLKYLARLGWRTLRLIASRQPALYPEVAAQVLKGYRSTHVQWRLYNSWIYNHIIFHEKHRGQGGESFYCYSRDYYKDRGFSDLWKRSISPLLNLLEDADQSSVMTFVTEALMKDFRGPLGQLDASWVTRVAQLRRSTTDSFLLTWFSELCPTPQAEYAAHGFHAPLLTLLWSTDSKTAQFALTYFQAHSDALLELINAGKAMAFARSQTAGIRTLGEALLNVDTGHFKLDLDQWTTLLNDPHSFKFAAQQIKRAFSGKDLSLEWYATCINSTLEEASQFAMTLLKDPTYQPQGGDLLGFYWALLTPKSWRAKSAKAAFEGLESLNSDGARLLTQLSTAQWAALLLHPERGGRRAFQEWVKKSWVSPRVFEVDWLKSLLSQEAWDAQEPLAALGDEGTEWRAQSTYQSEWGRIARGWLLSSAFTWSELGEKWLLDQALSSSGEARPYQTYMKTNLPLSAFEVLSVHKRAPSPQEPKRRGLEALISTLLTVRDDSVRMLLIQTLKDRHAATIIARDPNASPLKPELELEPPLLTFEVFERLAWSREERCRNLAIHFAHFELKRWTEEAPLTFARLLPFFVTGAVELQEYLLRAMSATPDASSAYIDVTRSQFDPEELYRFCFSPRSKVRDLGLTLIREHATRFADPARLATLAESSDRRVCESVVHLLWDRLKASSVTRPWTPFAQSVSPQSGVAKRQDEIIAELPPQHIRPDGLKGRRYIGPGLSASPSADARALDWLSDFLRRTIFRLSPKHPYKEDLGRLTKTTSGWRNKVTLIKAMRDLAVIDEAFAGLISPILEEFMATRGRSEKAACLVALTRIRAAHPELTW